MAESDVSAVKVFNFIIGSGGYCTISNLMKHPSPLAKKSSVFEVESWLRTESKSDDRFVLFKNQYGGRILGVRIDLKKRMCLQYCTTGSCRSKDQCKFWHICKKYIEGSCKGECGASHNFHDEENVEKTNELGFEAKANGAIRNMVAGCFPQICLKYLRNECASDNCPFLHVCANAVRVSKCGGDCTCPLLHDFSDLHNRTILEQYGFLPPKRSAKVGVVECNVMVPKQQKSFDDSCVSGPIGPVNAGDSRLFQGNLPGSTGIKKLLQIVTVDPDKNLLVKVFNYLCSKGGFAYLSELVKHPSPLAKKFQGHEPAAKSWIQSHSLEDSEYKLAVVENCGGNSAAVRIDLRRKICVNYFRRGSCGSGIKCKFWHICKGYIEGKCKSTCEQGQSHDFFDADNEAKTREVGLEVHPSGTVRKIVYWSLPHVCTMYLSNICNAVQCPFLHVCTNAAQGSPCQCVLSHDLADLHNKAVLRQYGLVPSKTLRLEIVHCNILIPKLVSSGVKAFPSSFLKDDVQVPQDKEQTGISGVKKKRIRKKQSKKGSNQQGIEQEELGDSEEEQPDWENNEDKLKPDFYSRIKFVDNPIEQTTQQKPVRLDHSSASRDLSKNQAASNRAGKLPSSLNVPEENLIDLSDEFPPDMQGVDSSMDDLWNIDSIEPLSQVDQIFFNDCLSPGAAESLSQDSTFFLSDPSSLNMKESHLERSNDNPVFECICKEFNCRVPFSVISKRQELFPPEVTDIAEWFKARPNKFLITEKNNGEMDEVRAYSPKARVCVPYLSPKHGCKNPRCFRFHVCKHYIANGECPFGKKCNFSHSHSLKSQHNRKIARALKLHGFSEKQLRLLVAASVPEVCQDFNSKSCQRGTKCIGIHICRGFVMHRCKNGDLCPFGHQAALQGEHTTMVLNKYKLSKVPVGSVFGMLLVRQVHAKAAANKTVAVSEGISSCQADTTFPYICLEFLLGHCSKEPLCECYHSNMPYVWQYRNQESQDKWKSFTQRENEDIERQFCVVQTGTTVMKNIMIPPPPSLLIHPGEGDVKMNFVEMKGETEFEAVELRRLSTKSALSPTDHALLTKWAWYWLDENGSWKEFGWGPLEGVKPEQIESSFMRGSSFFKFRAGDKNHKLFFRTVPMFEQTMTSPQESSSKKEVRRRPVFRSNAEVEKLKSPFELLVPIEPEAKPGVMELVPGCFPSQWTTVPESEDFIRVDLEPHSEQYKLVQSLFRQSLSETRATIASIERVQNPFLWEKYTRKREQMEKKAANRKTLLNEKLLFHGADHENADIICENNIDWRLNEDRASAFGQGAYFTTEAALSNLYCNEDNMGWRFMFLSEVLVGSYTQGKPTIKRPPSREDSTSKKELYDSCVDNVQRPTIFVLFNPDQYYPSFLIKYKVKIKVVC